ncbi:MAG: 30S ribosomal protein S16 [Bacteroidetes bacterium]|nr:MAG: 30S ribosomal protein S16 [Bacteroidota bacterium]
MPAKIRLQRHGKKGQPFYHIVVADGRAPRDGKFIEKIGTYNPLTKPAEIVLNFDKALQWLQHGAQPTDTVRSILSYKGVLYKNHLLKGVKKNALTEIEAEAKFNKWLEEKKAKIEQASKDETLKKKEIAKKRLEAEKEVNEKRSAEISKRRQEEMAALEAAAKAAAKEAAEAIEGKEETEEGAEENTATESANE